MASTNRRVDDVDVSEDAVSVKKPKVWNAVAKNVKKICL